MNYAIDNATPVQPPVPAADSEARLTQVADMVLTRAFLNADRIDSREIGSEKDRVVIRVENVFQSANSVYIRCSIHNRTTRPYRMLQPQVYELASSPNGDLTCQSSRHAVGRSFHREPGSNKRCGRAGCQRAVPDRGSCAWRNDARSDRAAESAFPGRRAQNCISR